MRACLALAMIGCCTTSVLSEPIEDFYRNKQITLVLSTGAGGGYATYAQAFVPFLTKHLPGHPNIVIQNMPGAGGIRAMMNLSTVAARDGTVMGLVHSSVPFAPLYGIKGANFDPRKMNWIGSINTSTAICLSWTASGITTWQDLYDKQYIVGGSGAGSQMETMPAMINKLFGTHIKIISGYTGGNDIFLAMERGELNGRCGALVATINSTRPDWFTNHKVSVPIVVALHRHPQFPDSPAIVEFAKDEATRKVLELALAPVQMDRPLLVPPGVPLERVEALRNAFHEAMNDPDFVAEAKRLQLEIGEVPGTTIQALLDQSFSLPSNVVREARDAMNLTGSSAD